MSSNWLSAAAASGSVETTAALLLSGGDPLMPDDKGQTAVQEVNLNSTLANVITGDGQCTGFICKSTDGKRLDCPQRFITASQA